MNDIRTLLRIAGRRLEIVGFIGRMHLVAIVAAGLAVALMLTDRVGAASFVPWMWVGSTLAGLTLLVSLALWMRRRNSDLHVAVEVDERLDLREKLSTALACQGRTDAFAQAAIEDAVNTARDPRTRELVSRRFGITAPGGWWISPVLVLAALMLSLLRPLDLFGSEDPAQNPDIIQAKADAQQALEALVKEIEKKPEINKEIGDLLGELSKEGIDPDAMKSPEQLKRDVIKKITDVNKKLDEILNGEKSKTSDALEKSLSQLRPPENGDAKEMAEALAKGDFQGAKDKLQELMDKAKNGELNPDQAKQLEEQLKDIAAQLEKLALQQKQLEEALKQAGMDPQLANNPQALQQAIQQNQNLNQQQKQQLQQQAAAQQAACKMCQNMGQACQQMAQAMGQGQAGQAGQMGQAGQAMMEQLNAAEQMQMLLQQAQAAAAQCQGQCQNMGQNLSLAQCQGQGGMGNRGQGAGGKAPVAPTPTKTKLTKADTKQTEGDIIAKMLFDGPQVVGESKIKQLQAVVEEARQGFDEAVQEDLVPLKYHDALKHYAGEFEAFTKAIEAPEGESKPKPAEAPAEAPAAE